MKNNRKNRTHIERLTHAAREQARKNAIAALREGRKVRAVTFTDRKREASRKACRGRVVYNG